MTFEKQGGVGGTTTVIATIGSPMPAATAPTKAGAVFDGYFAGPNGSGARYYTAAMASARNWDIAGNTELIAHWVYEIGATGPAGGIVFYDKGEYTDGWRYMEAWTADEGNYAWKNSSTVTGGTSQTIGSGYQNTYGAMLGTQHPAAQVVRSATHGGYGDWFLPSEDELNQMYQNLHLQGLGGFVSSPSVWYWSSTENNLETARGQNFNTGLPTSSTKATTDLVRAARAF